MNKGQTIILDYFNGRVVVLATKSDEANLDDDVARWCEENGVSINNCNWMLWDGTIKIQP